MKWYEELRLTRRPLDQVGMTMIVREIFDNDLRISANEADMIFGAGWKTKAEELKRAGVIRFSDSGHVVTMTVVAPGDKRRANQKKYAAAKRKSKGKQDEKTHR